MAEAAPGDEVDLKTIRKKKSFLEAKIINFHKYSDLRTDPFCSHYGLCGGCKWQHLEYSHQLSAKRQQIIDNFSRIGKFEFPEVNQIVGSEKTQFYRNKLEYTFSNKKWITQEEIESGDELNRNGVGFHLPGHFDKVVDVETCYLQDPVSNKIRNSIREFTNKNQLSFYDIQKNEGLLRNLIVRTSTTGELMVIVQFGDNNEDQISDVMEFIKKSFSEITSLNYVINQKKNETFNDLDVVLYHGRSYIVEVLSELSFKIGPKSFFQTNSKQTEKLYGKALEMAKLTKEETVYDLYCGTGTITNFIARSAHQAIGIEAVIEAIDDARENAQLNQIENSTFYTGDVKDVLNDQFFQSNPRPDVIFTDPPRAGMHKDVVETILKLQPEKIVYISCNPATQARDLAALVENYSIQEIQPFDMFPHTHHLENIVSLQKRK